MITDINILFQISKGNKLYFQFYILPISYTGNINTTKINILVMHILIMYHVYKENGACSKKYIINKKKTTFPILKSTYAIFQINIFVKEIFKTNTDDIFH